MSFLREGCGRGAYDKLIPLEEILSSHSILLTPYNKIKKGDVVINAGLTSDILQNLDGKNLKKSFIKQIYGLYVDKDLDESVELSDLYKKTINYAGKKKGIDRAISITNSFYENVFFRMMEYSDNYSMEKGIMTSLDLEYLESNNYRKGKVLNLESALSDGPFFCHEFAVILYIFLDREKNKTGLEPFYRMGIVSNGQEEAEHCWIELKNKKGKILLLDRISNVAEFIDDENKRYFKSKSGIKYFRDNGPFIARRLKD